MLTTMTQNTQELSPDQFSSKYHRIFPTKLSTATFLKLYILYLLFDGRSYYGKEIVNFIAMQFNDTWSPSHGMVYPILKTLEEKGYIVGEWSDATKKSKRFYTITDAGIDVYNKEHEAYEAMFLEAYNMVTVILGNLYNRKDLPLLDTKRV